jgi:crotonobetainyl-CoA:carnitine CoA-transferase CaiB-like acyl-CoA transferase
VTATTGFGLRTPPAGDAFLAGVRVLQIESGDPATALAGRLLAQLGADVLCVEPPWGSSLRSAGPFPDGVPNRARSAGFSALNYGKQGITLNLRTATGQANLARLLEQADVFVLSQADFDAGFGLDADSLAEQFPHLVAACISPFGLTGPLASWTPDDLLVSALAGMAAATGPESEAPLPLPDGLASLRAAWAAVVAILAAVLAEDETGKGDFIDVAALDAWLTLDGNPLLASLYRGVTGNRRQPVFEQYPSHALACRDGFVFVDCSDDAEWHAFVAMMGNPAWTSDARYLDRSAIARECAAEVDGLIEGWLRAYPREELWAMAREHGVPLVPVYTFDEVVRHPHLLSRRFFLEPAWDGYGWHLPGLPFRVDEARGGPVPVGPRLGEANISVLEDELSFSREEIVRMKAAGVI